MVGITGDTYRLYHDGKEVATIVPNTTYGVTAEDVEWFRLYGHTMELDTEDPAPAEPPKEMTDQPDPDPEPELA